MALRKPDVIEGVLVGGAICTGLLTVIAGAALGILPLLLGGATLCTAAVPLAASFKNEDSIGVKLYTGLAIAIFAMGATDTVMTALGVDAGSLTSAWMLTFVASIWLSAFGVKRG